MHASSQCLVIDVHAWSHLIPIPIGAGRWQGCSTTRTFGRSVVCVDAQLPKYADVLVAVYADVFVDVYADVYANVYADVFVAAYVDIYADV